MAYYFIFPEKDATIYSHPDRTKMNTGGDEILEIVKEKGSAIFLHLCDKKYKSTNGCIAVEKKNFLKILPLINNKTKILIR